LRTGADFKVGLPGIRGHREIEGIGMPDDIDVILFIKGHAAYLSITKMRGVHDAVPVGIEFGNKNILFFFRASPPPIAGDKCFSTCIDGNGSSPF
jgi:hypothetical protein